MTASIIRNRGTLLSLFIILANQISFNDALSSVSRPSTNLKSPLFQAHLKASSSKGRAMTLTYLEINGWLLSMSAVTILIDPLLEGPLDFGIPDLYKGQKRVLPAWGVTEYLPPIDCVLLTQGLDDHAHVKTLRKLKALDPNVPIVAPLSAKKALKACGFMDDDDSTGAVQFLKHGQETTVTPRRNEPDLLVGSSSSSSSSKQSSSIISIRATEGALVGPPWQRRENGYLLRGTDDDTKASPPPSLYIEPHVEFNPQELRNFAPVDVVISPISGQTLPAFELVHGPRDTIRLLETLKPTYLVPMQNGDVDTEGPVGQFVSEVGSPAEFRERLAAASKDELLNAPELVNVIPGEDIELKL